MSEHRSAVIYTKVILNTGKTEVMVLVCMIPLYDSCQNAFSRLITAGSKNQELTKLTHILHIYSSSLLYSYSISLI